MAVTIIIWVRQNYYLPEITSEPITDEPATVKQNVDAFASLVLERVREQLTTAQPKVGVYGSSSIMAIQVFSYDKICQKFVITVFCHQ